MGATVLQTKLGRPSKQLRLGQTKAEPAYQAFAAVLRQALPAELQAHGATLPKSDIEAMADALARVVANCIAPPIAPAAGSPAAPQGEWITTQEAANRCGFSRPFVAALLDSGAYQGKVQRTPGGHRKVLANEFQALVAQASAQAPKTLAQARQAVDLTRLDEAATTPTPVRKQSRARAQALAKKLGIAA